MNNDTIYVVKEINLLFFKCVQMFLHKSKGKCRMGDNSSSSQARSGTCANFFAVMVLLNFFTHPHLLLIYCFIIYILSLFLFVGHFGLLTLTWGLYWGFERQGPAADGGSREIGGPAGGSQRAGGRRGPARGSWGAGGALIWGGWPAIGQIQVGSILILFWCFFK
jgi:hypothetical protein